jgi:hypothetical protein
MPAKELSGIYAKVSRASAQIPELARMVEGFFLYWPIGQVSKMDAARDEEVWSFAIGSEILPDIPVAIGEILHNIRSSLDQLACAIAEKTGGAGRDTYFPFGADANALDEQIKQKCKRLPQGAIDLVHKWKPYHGGNDLLWAVHDLNRSDKHRHVVPVNLSTGSNKTTYLTVWTGLVLVIGHRQAQHLMVHRASAEEISKMGSPTAVYSVPRGTHLNFSTQGCTADESLEFLRTTPGATFTTDMRPLLNLAFAGTARDPLQPVCSVLSEMTEEVRKVIVDFEKAFF